MKKKDKQPPQPHPDNALLSLADKHRREGRPLQARHSYRQIIDNNPNHDRALALLSEIQSEAGEYEDAERNLLKAIKINPGFAGYYINLGMIYCCTHQWEKAIDINNKALETDNNNILALFNTGFALRGKGDLKKSIYYFQRVTELKPDFVGAYISLCAIYHRLEMTDDLIGIMRRMEAIVDSLGLNEKIGIYYTLGRYYDLFDKHEKAFSYLEKANRLKLEQQVYDYKQDVEALNNIVHNINPEFIQENKGCGVSDNSPIFIVGMPRSGTSLIEQMLSCHPDVNPGGELNFLHRLIQHFNFATPRKSCKDIARQYLQAIAGIKGDKKCFTDKLPHNFLYVGLIYLCFRDAKIIHCVRDAMDTCFSCYKQDFRRAHHFSNDLTSLGHYYNAYLKLMAHWHTILPGHMLDVKYEDIVNNPKAEVERMLAYCNLPWNDACLNFHSSSRFVDTASRDQVAKPIYISSVGRWKHYQQYLHSLQNILKQGSAV